MPDHVHILIRKHRDRAEQMIDRFQEASRSVVCERPTVPRDHPVWTDGGGWKVFLETPEDIRRTIAYIQRNPINAGLPPQRWPFVTSYDDWPLHKRR